MRIMKVVCATVILVTVTAGITIALYGREIVVRADVGEARRYVPCYETAVVTVCAATAFMVD